jgi:AraC-like DNA-binding protein
MPESPLLSPQRHYCVPPRYRHPYPRCFVPNFGRVPREATFVRLTTRNYPILCGLVRRGTMSQVTSSTATEQHLRDLARLRRVRDRIDREYAQPLDVEALARGAHMSAGHLSREFRLAYGEPPYAYVMTRRIERAMALLRRGDLSVTEVCFAVGCSSLGTFSTRFTELVGVPPSVYRREGGHTTAGMPPCVAKQVTRPIRAGSIRNEEAPASEPQLA